MPERMAIIASTISASMRLKPIRPEDWVIVAPLLSCAIQRGREWDLAVVEPPIGNVALVGLVIDHPDRAVGVQVRHSPGVRRAHIAAGAGQVGVMVQRRCCASEGSRVGFPGTVAGASSVVLRLDADVAKQNS